jgi:hypothetical protein
MTALGRLGAAAALVALLALGAHPDAATPACTITET